MKERIEEEEREGNRKREKSSEELRAAAKFLNVASLFELFSLRARKRFPRRASVLEFFDGKVCDLEPFSHPDCDEGDSTHGVNHQ